MSFGGAFFHAVRKLPRRGDFRVQAEFGGSVESFEPDRALVEISQRLMTALPAPAVLARVDVVGDKQAPMVIGVELIELRLFFSSAPASVDRACAALMQAIDLSGGRYDV